MSPYGSLHQNLLGLACPQHFLRFSSRMPSFNTTGRAEGVAANWAISGPIEVLTTMGGEGLAAQAGAKLWQRMEVQPGGRYLMYAKISVARGAVVWSLADTSRGMESRGALKPSQVSEVISDVVESRSGYLDASFELTEAGGFRVMDVIVTEVPSDAVENRQHPAHITQAHN